MSTDHEQRDLDAMGSGSDSKTKASVGGHDFRERHKLAERERRKSMRELFLSLHSVLPHADTVRKEQATILDEIIKYIPLAVARLRALRGQKTTPSVQPKDDPPAILVSDHGSPSSDSTDFDIRVAPQPSLSVGIRIRGDQVNVSVVETKETSQSLLLSSVLDSLEDHFLEVTRLTNCRDGNKLLHHFECKISDGSEHPPAMLKARLQELAYKIHMLRKTSSKKRTFDQMDS